MAAGFPKATTTILNAITIKLDPVVTLIAFFLIINVLADKVFQWVDFLVVFLLFLQLSLFQVVASKQTTSNKSKRQERSTTGKKSTTTITNRKSTAVHGAIHKKSINKKRLVIGIF